jgi:3-oxoacyl-[acyl-carrier protein] reductase
MQLNGKTALVTGASRGIGYATAVTFGTQGVNVAIHYGGHKQGAEEALADIEKAGGKGIVVTGDVADKAAVDAMVAQTQKELGPIDYCVANAGTLVERCQIKDMDPELWHRCLGVNLHSFYYTVKAVLPSMIERKTGAIVGTSSLAARLGGGMGAAAYAAAKAGMNGLTRTLAKELAQYNIRVNNVSPGLIKTKYHEDFNTPEGVEKATASIPLKRWGTWEDVSDVILFLCAEESRYMTGQTLEVNGGMFNL